MPKKLLNVLVIAGAIAAAVAAVKQTTNMSAFDHGGQERERCYGIARAGRNDCGTPTHSCSAQSQSDGDAESWVMVPKGLCEKLVGGAVRDLQGRNP